VRRRLPSTRPRARGPAHPSRVRIPAVGVNAPLVRLGLRSRRARLAARRPDALALTAGSARSGVAAACRVTSGGLGGASTAARRGTTRSAYSRPARVSLGPGRRGPRTPARPGCLSASSLRLVARTSTSDAGSPPPHRRASRARLRRACAGTPHARHPKAPPCPDRHLSATEQARPAPHRSTQQLHAPIESTPATAAAKVPTTSNTSTTPSSPQQVSPARKLANPSAPPSPEAPSTRKPRAHALSHTPGRERVPRQPRDARVGRERSTHRERRSAIAPRRRAGARIRHVRECPFPGTARGAEAAQRLARARAPAADSRDAITALTEIGDRGSVCRTFTGPRQRAGLTGHRRGDSERSASGALSRSWFGL
jgi:hypothetical protein